MVERRTVRKRIAKISRSHWRLTVVALVGALMSVHVCTRQMTTRASVNRVDARDSVEIATRTSPLSEATTRVGRTTRFGTKAQKLDCPDQLSNNSREIHGARDRQSRLARCQKRYPTITEIRKVTDIGHDFDAMSMAPRGRRFV